MVKMLSGMVGRVAEKLLPKTTAAAACRKECWHEWNDFGKTSRCCVLEDCHTITCTA
ncbi:hypothetical protein AB0J81_18010 [Streptomyces bobili]|uniref:hypothetical protein n=1 Tax=Streptomyces bobili TaxID=67280 RepID=UPI003445459F